MKSYAVCQECRISLRIICPHATPITQLTYPLPSSTILDTPNMYHYDWLAPKLDSCTFFCFIFRSSIIYEWSKTNHNRVKIYYKFTAPVQHENAKIWILILTPFIFPINNTHHSGYSSLQLVYCQTVRLYCTTNHETYCEDRIGPENSSGSVKNNSQPCIYEKRQTYLHTYNQTYTKNDQVPLPHLSASALQNGTPTTATEELQLSSYIPSWVWMSEAT